MQSSARGSALRFWCERSLCTLGKRLSRRRVCSAQFCTHAHSGRAQQTLAQKRTSCCRHCKRKPCSTLLQSSSSLQLCCPVQTRRNSQISLSEPTVPCPSSRQPIRELPSRVVAHSLVLPRFSTQSASPPALSQTTREERVAPPSERTAWPPELSVSSGQCVPRTSADLASRCSHTTVLSVFDGPQDRSTRARLSQNAECQLSCEGLGCTQKQQFEGR